MKLTENQKQQWKQRIEEWKASGITSVAEWCRKHEINIDQFYYWKSRLLLVKTLMRQSFIELAPDQDSGISLECSGVRIHLASHFDPVIFTKCIALLKGFSCSK